MISRYFRRFADWCERHWVEFFAGSAVFLLLFFVMWPLIVHNIPPGHVGVLWLRFFSGTVLDKTLEEGIQFTFPWDKIYVYNARLQRVEEKVTGLSIDGLDVGVTVVARFVIDAPHVASLHKALGPEYVDTLIRPQLRTIVLTKISESEAEDLYSLDREKLQNDIQSEFNEDLASIESNVSHEGYYTKLEDVLVEEIVLPPFVRQAIEEKERVRHMSEAYQFRLTLEDRERQRKQIEAEGIRVFQEIVSPGITESYLRWRGIEATLQLATSNNAKVVIIGSGKDGLPIILNTEGEPLRQTPIPQGGMTPPGEAGGAAPGGNPSAGPEAPGAPATPPAPGGAPSQPGGVGPQGALPRTLGPGSYGGSGSFLPFSPEQGPLRQSPAGTYPAVPGLPAGTGTAPAARESQAARAEDSGSEPGMFQRLYNALNGDTVQDGQSR